MSGKRRKFFLKYVICGSPKVKLRKIMIILHKKTNVFKRQDNPPFQDKILRKNGAKILHSDWLIAKFGQLQSVVSRVSCVLY